MPESLKQFGDRIKAKYPDYADMDSIELANKMIAKYPEYKDQVVMEGPADPYGRPIAREEGIREEYPSEKFARYAEPISQFGGMLAKTPGIGAGLAGAATMGTEIARQGIQAIGSEPGTPTTFTESGKRIASAFGRGSAGEALARTGFAGAAKIGEKMAPRLVKTGAQLMKTTAGIPEQTGKAVLSDMSLLGRAKPISESGDIYARAMEQTGLKQGPQAAMEVMGKSALSQEGATNFAFDAIKRMEEGILPYQEALVARDQIKNILKMPKWQNPSIAQNEKFLIEMQSKLDSYLEPYFKEAGGSFAEARKGYSESMKAKDFESWLPQNANKTASVLRGAAGLGLAGSGYATDNPVVTALGLAAMSPRLLGYGIRGAAIAGPSIKETAKLGTRLGTQAISNEMLPSSTEELMRKYNEKK